ncbi:MAG TPA: CBS domain-containing protein [Anaerolineales bacterium]|nr:CBS domain-containing protein [Anaerolineales bacterium]
MEHLLVVDWMTRNPYIVSPWASLLDAYGVMQSYEIRRLPVVEDGRLVGILTINDIRSAVPIGLYRLSEQNRRMAGKSVDEVMSRHPITIHKNASMADAAQIMYENKIGGLPVIEGGQLVGVITESDLFRLVMIEARVAEA